MRFALVAHQATPTNDCLTAATVGSSSWELMSPRDALEILRPGDAALGRLDVLPTLDGVEEGLWALGALAARGIAVLNDAAALLALHDKLLTARLLRRARIRHPATAHIRPGRPFPAIRLPVVVKPRFGSGGRDVVRCDDQRALDATLAGLGDTPWYQQQGAVVQELITPVGYDLRLLIAGERVVGAVFRIAAQGEWRTNIALGGTRQSVSDPPLDACGLAIDAARAAGAALVGVDLVPDESGDWTVIELNGAVEFTHEYRTDGDVFADVAVELARYATDGLASTDSFSTYAA